MRFYVPRREGLARLSASNREVKAPDNIEEGKVCVGITTGAPPKDGAVGVEPDPIVQGREHQVQITILVQIGGLDRGLGRGRSGLGSKGRVSA